MLKKRLSQTDSKAFSLLQEEIRRQQNTLNLIASENYPSLAVLQALGSVFNNKYSEGYPSKRYYSGNEVVDKVERLAQTRALQLFVPPKERGNWRANVQPYSGSPANLAVYFALLKKGEKVLAMDLRSGGHLTHGAKANFSSAVWQFAYYGVNPQTETIDFNEVEKLAKKHKPKLIVCGATAYPRKIDFSAFGRIAQKVGAYLMADIAHIAGLIAGRVHPSPVPWADVITSTTHKTLRGPRSAFILCRKELAPAIDRAVFPGLQGGPHNHEILAKAVCFKEAQSSEFKQYARQILKNARALAQILLEEGLRLVSGGTDNHLLLLDLRPLKLRGLQAQQLLERVGITANRNSIPFDPNPPHNPSGLRLGTPALTSRGMKEKEMEAIGKMIAKVLKTKKALSAVKRKVTELTKAFPLPY
ncbi:serine hydroxymethyltransferase [bacterium]|nr:serine hydroxymethyltransferase [bacterium]